jgi:hypothetical protein
MSVAPCPNCGGVGEIGSECCSPQWCHRCQQNEQVADVCGPGDPIRFCDSCVRPGERGVARLRIVGVLEHFKTDYYNAACSSWTHLDPHQFLSSHPTRQGEYAVLAEDGELVDIACRHCAKVLERDFGVIS